MSLTTTTLTAVASGNADTYEAFNWLQLIPPFPQLNDSLGASLGETWWHHDVVDLYHVFLALIMVAIVGILALFARRRLIDPENGVVPEKTFTPRNFFEIIFDAAYKQMNDAMGEKYARMCFPLVGTVICYVFFSNILGLIPGLAPPTDKLNATIAPAVIVFFATHWMGIKEHGVKKYLKHFLGPVPAIAPLFLIIELIGHFARILSLSFRLMGNMIGDHKVLASFLALTTFSFLFPVPMWFMGLIVCSVQTLVFALLTIVYIQLAVAHADEH